MMKWISVKNPERPKINQIVVVWLSHLNEPACARYTIDEIGDYWIELVEVDRYNKRDGYVSHWMPLPEPPKD